MLRFFKLPAFWATVFFAASLTQPYYRNLRYEWIDGSREGFLVKGCDFNDLTYAAYHGLTVSTQLALAFLLLLMLAAWMQRKFQVSCLVTGSLFLYLFFFIIATFCGGMHSSEAVSYDQPGVGFTSYGESIGAGPGLYLFMASAFFTTLSLFVKSIHPSMGVLPPR